MLKAMRSNPNKLRRDTIVTLHVIRITYTKSVHIVPVAWHLLCCIGAVQQFRVLAEFGAPLNEVIKLLTTIQQRHNGLSQYKLRIVQ
eukprot:17144-Eustigmatos_ZCMA.PRE.1